ncbi:short-chain dehydrogenase/reductase, partial [Streptomyces amritsarensis]
MNTTANPLVHLRTWLITGATSGIGRELTLQALENGDTVPDGSLVTYVRLDELAQAHGERLVLI